MSLSIHPLRVVRLIVALGLVAVVVACGRAEPEQTIELIDGIPADQIVQGYGPIQDGIYFLPPIPPAYLQGVNRRALVPYFGGEGPGTIEIDPHAKFLFWVMEGGLAMRYPIAVGREGRGINGETTINRVAEWPGWTPTANMLRSEPEVYGAFAGGVPGGLSSPLGARALYLYRGGRDSFYRIHGTNDLGSIGNFGSAGCIRMFNQDVIDLYERISLGSRVVIRSYEDSVRLEGQALANRGVELPPFIISPSELLAGASGQRPPVPAAMINADGSFAGTAGALSIEGQVMLGGPLDPATLPGQDGSAIFTPITAGDPLSSGTLGTPRT